MKRCAALQPLSREHHQALVISKRLLAAYAERSGGLAADWDRWRRRYLCELEPHFAAEEQALLPLLEAEGAAYAARLQHDHRQLLTQLQSEQVAVIPQFAEQLKQHVRFEERELFVWLEDRYDTLALANALAEVGGYGDDPG